MTPQTLATEWHLLSSSHALLVQEALWQPLMFYQESPFGLQALGRKISIHNTSRIRCRYPSPFNSCKWLCEPWAHRLPLGRWLVSFCCSFTIISVQDHFFWSNGHLNEVEQKQFLFPRIQIKFPERESPDNGHLDMSVPVSTKNQLLRRLKAREETPPAPHPSYRGGGGTRHLIIGLAEIQLHKSFFSSLWQLFLI